MMSIQHQLWCHVAEFTFTWNHGNMICFWGGMTWLVVLLKPLCIMMCTRRLTCVALKAIHLGKKLIQGLFTLVISTSHSSASCPSDGINLINKDDAWCILLCLHKGDLCAVRLGPHTRMPYETMALLRNDSSVKAITSMLLHRSLYRAWHACLKFEMVGVHNGRFEK